VENEHIFNVLMKNNFLFCFVNPVHAPV